ncbi:MAG: hypothetical protein WCK68_03930 [Betaproteobacteria bacterium]|jgi:hypothetical protein
MKDLTNTTYTDPKQMHGVENYEKIIQELQIGGLLDLKNLLELTYVEKNDLFQEILRWSVFGNGDLKKLKNTPPTYHINSKKLY